MFISEDSETKLELAGCKIINFRTHDDPFLFFFQFPETKAILDLFPSAEHRTLIAIG